MSTYHIPCDCGKRVPVELFQAGSTIDCPRCHAILSIPNSAKLKELTGDKYPYLTPIEKIRRTLAEGEPPFDGTCHQCGDVDAEFQIPIRLDVMKERHVADDGGIRPTLTGEIRLVVSAAEEQRESTTFPLLLCPRCLQEFNAEQSHAKILRAGKTVLLIGILSAFLCFAYFYAELIAALEILFFIILAVAMAARFRQSRRGNHFVLPWLHGIRWATEAVSTEDEYNLSVGAAAQFELRK